MARKIIDLPLHEDKASILLPWIIGLMIYAVLFVLTIALSLSFYIQTKTQVNFSQVTLEIPTTLAQSRQETEQQVLEKLKHFPQIASFTPVSFQHVQGVVLPWIEPPEGSAQLLPDISLPILIDIVLHKKTTENDGPRTILKEIQQAFPKASLISHGNLFEHLMEWFKTLECIAWGSAGIFLSIAVLAVISMVQTGLSIHAPIVEILYLMGASENYIARQFQRQTLGITLKSFLLAGFLAVMTVICFQLFFEGSSFDFPLTQRFYGQLGMIFLVIPAISALVIVLTTRLTVIFSLKNSF